MKYGLAGPGLALAITLQVLLLLPLVPAALVQTKGSPEHIRAATARVDTQFIRANERDTADWPSHGLDHAETRFSRLTQISTANVGKLGLAWSYNLESSRGVEATPVVVHGIMDVTASWGSPWAQKKRRPAGGDNLYLASILALNPDNEKMRLALPGGTGRQLGFHVHATDDPGRPADRRQATQGDPARAEKRFLLRRRPQVQRRQQTGSPPRATWFFKARPTGASSPTTRATARSSGKRPPALASSPRPAPTWWMASSK